METRADLNNAFSARGERGFSLLELLVVVAITFVVAAMAMPSMSTMLADYQLKSSASQLAGLIQRCRTASVRANQSLQLQTATVNNQQQFYLDLNADSQWNAGEPVTILPHKVSLQGNGFPGDATTGLGTNNAQWYSTPARFNARGLPCVDVTGGGGATTCKNINAGNNAVGYVYYLRSDRVFGATGWAAVTVTPAGRVKAWFHSGTNYQ